MLKTKSTNLNSLSSSSSISSASTFSSSSPTRHLNHMNNNNNKSINLAVELGGATEFNEDQHSRLAVRANSSVNDSSKLFCLIGKI